MFGFLCLTLSPSPGLHSPPLLGTAAVPGLMAPIPNGFPGVLPLPGSHPALETVYANGLVPYPGNLGECFRATDSVWSGSGN